MSAVELILFDLDGTLIDTSQDLAGSANALRRSRGLEAVEVDRVISWVGDGARMLVARSLGVPADRADVSEDVESGLAFFREHYVAHMLDRAVPYPGVLEGLASLRERGLELAVVSNKPEAMCVEILDRLGLGRHFLDVLGGDRLPVRKPDPAPVRYMLETVGVRADRAIMAGDGAQDMRAGKAAGCVTVAALYGFRSREELEPTRPDHWIEEFGELLALVRAQGAPS